MFGIGMPELILILAIALMVIGPKKLPDLAKSLGRAMREFKKATSELKGSMELDGDMKDVKETFEDIRSDIKDSVLEDTAQTRSEPSDGQKAADLEKAYDDWQEDRPSDPKIEDSAGVDAQPEATEPSQPAETKTDRVDDASEKDR